ncbi:MAG: hypothetical protein ACKVOK_04300, partial [Flavobacteriales bacterium]
EIIDLELISEINNVGVRGDGSNTYVAAPWLEAQLGTCLSYGASHESRDIIGEWQIEMAEYIKEELQHTRHLIAACYTGQPMWGADFNGDEAHCGDEFFDKAWKSSKIDIIAFSSYDLELSRWQKFSDPEAGGRYQWRNMWCDINTIDGEIVHEHEYDYYDILKIAIHSEQSSAAIPEDVSAIEKDMWCNAFSGFASSGMHWGYMHRVRTGPCILNSWSL